MRLKFGRSELSYGFASVCFVMTMITSAPGLAQTPGSSRPQPEKQPWGAEFGQPAKSGYEKSGSGTKTILETFGVKPAESVEGVVHSQGGFVPVGKVSLNWLLRSANEAQGTGSIVLLPDQIGEITTGDPQNAIKFMVDLPKAGKPKITVLSERNELVVRKDVIFGIYDLSEFSRDPSIRGFLEEAIRATDSWDVGVYAWNPDYIELRLLKAGATAKPFRVYVAPNSGSQATKRKFDEHLMAYYWVAASYAFAGPKERETFLTLAQRALSKDAVRRFLVSYGEGR